MLKPFCEVVKILNASIHIYRSGEYDPWAFDRQSTVGNLLIIGILDQLLTIGTLDRILIVWEVIGEHIHIFP